MRSNPCILLAAFLALCAAPALLPAADPPTSQTVEVDCTDPDPDKHGSVNKALKKKADELVIEISGICTENVFVTRPNVTLRGTNPLTDGIRSPGILPSGLSSALFVQNTQVVTIENLKLTGGTSGLDVTYSFGVRAENCRLEDNTFPGAFVTGARLTMVDTVITGNGIGGVWLGNAGVLFCVNCTIVDNPGGGLGRGILAQEASRVSLQDSTISGDRLGIRIKGGGEVFVGEGNDPAPTLISSTQEPTGRPSGAIDADGNVKVTVVNASIEGPILARTKAVMILRNVSQTIPPDFIIRGNTVTLDSMLAVSGGTTLAGDLIVSRFSNAEIFAPAAVGGNLNCDARSDAFCDDPQTNVGGTSNCGLCPKP